MLKVECAGCGRTGYRKQYYRERPYCCSEDSRVVGFPTCYEAEVRWMEETKAAVMAAIRSVR